LDTNVIVRGKEMVVGAMVVSGTLPVILMRLGGTASVVQSGVESEDPNEAAADAEERLEEMCGVKNDETVVAPERMGGERDIARKAWILGGGKRDRGDR
jgi:hypothetical protein